MSGTSIFWILVGAALIALVVTRVIPRFYDTERGQTFHPGAALFGLACFIITIAVMTSYRDDLMGIGDSERWKNSEGLSDALLWLPPIAIGLMAYAKRKDVDDASA